MRKVVELFVAGAREESGVDCLWREKVVVPFVQGARKESGAGCQWCGLSSTQLGLASEVPVLGTGEEL